ncbi:MAG: pentapeptide repeat-containing protein [Saprospiraceae bacterium]|nr:pentapeptide repeat-containing protein [Saprospiraceae bacterium]
MVEDQRYSGIDFTKNPLDKDTYDHCSFIDCDFRSSDLTNINFRECRFELSNLSLARIESTSFKDTGFSHSKMLGLDFSGINSFLLSLSFAHCQLDLSSFRKLQRRGTVFNRGRLEEVEFTETNLNAASFVECDLNRAIFAHTNLERPDFSTAFNYSLAPENNRLKKAIFSRMDLSGLLQKYQIEIR